MTVRPFRNYRYKPRSCRLLLDATGGAGKAWKPYWSNGNPWFQVYLNNEYTWVTRIATQGRVTTYKLRYHYSGLLKWYKGRGQRYAKVKKILLIKLLN